jgi:hypothetical protein
VTKVVTCLANTRSWVQISVPLKEKEQEEEFSLKKKKTFQASKRQAES